MTDARRPLVAFCMQWIPSYREGFYELLFERLDARGVDLRVLHGAPPASRRQRRDHVEPAWGELVPNAEFTVGGIEVTWQPVWRRVRRADLLVLQQEAALPFNYLALAHRRLGGPKVAMWGHGEFTDHTRQNATGERLKRMTTPLADWFFGYTEESARVARSIGVDPDRITVVNNSRPPDLSLNEDQVDEDVANLLAAWRRSGARVGWMTSALDTSKRLGVLVEILDEVRRVVPDFEFVVIGRGAEEQRLFDAADSRPWLHAVGTKFGASKAALGEVAEITIHPGLLGLHVIDSFQYGAPIVTQEGPWHSHETDYLTADNALVLDEAATASDLAAAAVDLLDRPEELSRLRSGCAAAEARYSIEAMADRFAEGICDALGASR